MKTSSSRSWADDLCHPLPIAAVLVLTLNDHVLKGSGLLPGWLTGKLSDFAGLFFFPLLLAALARGAARLAGRGEITRRRALALGDDRRHRRGLHPAQAVRAVQRLAHDDLGD